MVKEASTVPAIVRVARRGLVIHAAGIFRIAVVIDGSPSVFLRQELFDFPISLFCANTEFKVFLRDGVPVLGAALARLREQDHQGPPYRPSLQTEDCKSWQ